MVRVRYTAIKVCNIFVTAYSLQKCKKKTQTDGVVSVRNFNFLH